METASVREQWTSSTAFIVATIGSAIGLGNIWRFPYVAGENGGAAFLLVYLVLIALVGLPLMLAEFVVGRRGGADCVTSFEVAAPRSPLRFIGWIGMVGAILILSYYGVIAGWALKYFFDALTGTLAERAALGYSAHFAQFIGNGLEPAFWLALMMLASMAIVIGGVRRGIERANMLITPVLAVIVISFAAFAVTLPGAERGVAFLLAPDWSALARPGVYLAALGQVFFSLSIGMAVMITFASYTSREHNFPRSAVVICAGDSMFSIVAGLAIFPTVFSFGMNPAAGPELAFITLPQIFLEMPGGDFIGMLFFLFLVALALTSVVSLLEVPVAYAIHRLGVARAKATAVIGSATFLMGIPPALSYGWLKDTTLAGLPILDAVDRGVSNFVLPAGGILLALFVGWVLSPRQSVEDVDLAGSRFADIWLLLVRVVVPAMVGIILLNSLGVW